MWIGLELKRNVVLLLRRSYILNCRYYPCPCPVATMRHSRWHSRSKSLSEEVKLFALYISAATGTGVT